MQIDHVAARNLFLLVFALLLSGCESISGFLERMESAPDSVPLAERPVQTPIDPNQFVLASEDQEVIGAPQVVFTNENDTLSDIARAYGLGIDELTAANPGVDPWLPGVGTPILLPTEYVLPNVERKGVILNIATRRLFYFPEAGMGEAQQVYTYPIGIGRVGWETPLGKTSVIAKAKDPTWWVPASVRKEHAEMGDPLPSVVPPGPDNPLGHRVLKLDMPGYLIHGTNQPYGVGMRVSHGCVRLYPENIEFLYELVDIGVPVEIINEPYQLGRRDGVLYFEAHVPLEDDQVPAEERLSAILDAAVHGDGQLLNTHLREHIVSLSAAPNGAPTVVADYDANEVMARARVVENIIVPDPDAYTLEEIREMMSEVDEEAAETVTQ
ncbi:MAG: L,D-transpeptidase family protein [Pseudomonadota bacterium]